MQHNHTAYCYCPTGFSTGTVGEWATAPTIGFGRRGPQIDSQLDLDVSYRRL